MDDLRFLTNSYDDKIARIKSIKAPLNFVYITDEHNRLNQYTLEKDGSKHPGEYELAVNAIRSIQYLLDRCPEIRFVINGGDVGNDYNKDPKAIRESFQEVFDALYSLSVPVHNCVGNHDDALGACKDRGDDTNKYVILPEEMYAMCSKYNPTDELYYYFDVDPNYRFIILNTNDKPFLKDRSGQYAFGWRMEISQKQIEWFENDALKTQRRIVVVSHSPLHNQGIYGTFGAPIGIKAYDDTLNAPRAYYDIMQSQNVVFQLCGHVHHDNVVYDQTLLTITTQCSMAQEWAPASPKRTIGTITETAFDVFSITDDVVYMTRFGAGNDREAHILRPYPFPVGGFYS